MRRWLIALVAAGAGGAASAAEIVDSRFQIEFTYEGQVHTLAETIVPNLPDAACYYWYLRVDPATRDAVTLIETLTLPEPLAAWQGYVNDPASTTQIKPDAQGAATTLTATPDQDGWVSHGWCVAEGDPNGPHNITVTLDGAEVGNWDFIVVAATDYDFPDEIPVEENPTGDPEPPAPPQPPPQPSPLARDVHQSW
mgnify:CR=1 FL=1